MSGKIKQGFLSALVLTFISTACAAETLKCSRMVFNASNQPWTVEFHTHYGHVEMNGQNCTSGHCVLASGQSSLAKYFYDNGSIHRGPAAGGDIKFIDHSGNEKTMHYYSVDVGQENLCPEIKNYNSAEGVRLNTPENGGVEIVSDAW